MDLFKWLDGIDGMSGNQTLPVSFQFFLVNFSPSFDEPLLSLRHITGDQCHRFNRIYRSVFLVIDMKMRQVMRCRWLWKHPDDESKKSG